MKKTKLVNCIACCGKGKVLRIIRGKVTEEQKKETLRLYRKGYGIREIARMVKIKNPYSVTYIIKTSNNK